MSQKVYLSVLELFKPYKKNIVVISIVTLLTSVGSFLTPWLTQQLIDKGIMQSDFNQVLQLVTLLFLVFLVQQIFGLIQFYFYRDLSVRIPYDLNYKACKHVLKLKSKYFKERNFSEVMSEIFQDINNISSLTGNQFLTSFVSLFKIVAGLIALFFINWKLTLIMLATIPIKLLISVFFYKKQVRIYELIMSLQSKFAVWLSDTISGMTIIKMWGIGNQRIKKLLNILEDSKTAKAKLMWCSYVDSIASSSLVTVFTFLLYVFGALLINKNDITIGGLVSFVAYTALVFEPINILSYLMTQFSSVKPAFTRFIKFISTDTENDKSNSAHLPSSVQIENITFDHVSLFYDKERVLNNISFSIYKGERVAIIGPNGSGKSSLISLLLRLNDPDGGRIEINGTDISDYTFDSYRALWSYMAQDNYIFNDTIANNINIDETLTKGQILESCAKSGAMNFIEKLPNRLNTPVGFNGSKLSGGQRQKVALARALSKRNTKILVLDEATSNFDYPSEQLFFDTIMASEDRYITIIITHRPELLKKVDKIIYLNKGSIGGIGTFEFLYSNSDSFKDYLEYVKKEEDQYAVYSFSNQT
ncbi:hypothetical protein DCC85_01215 [Paenibacillus sp. CAA11]|uniref:ABC transporter ATP-binding protein n=1 Tax=Paenibacillus sp. CAA11 TaxID=1532905 RepID=UPI000D377972|nr:ABC transporter ATP-binding protein [Paenibacillus sp. CAA11]AWB42984.1 hypothetical protein DCC85_01215 [Paenibacillus sp. CAA11]